MSNKEYSEIKLCRIDSENYVPAKKRKYEQIENWKRRNLINTIISRGISIKEAAELLGIKYSAAKYIYKQYRNHKRVDVRTKKLPRDFSKDNEFLMDSNQPQNDNKFVSHPIPLLNSSKTIGLRISSDNLGSSNIDQKTVKDNFINQSDSSKIQKEPEQMSSIVKFDFLYYKRSIIERYYYLVI